MAFADYYRRGAVAAAQALAGFDEDAFKQALRRPVGISAGVAAAASASGRTLCDLVVRLVARLYPVICLADVADADLRKELASLASSINPAIELTTERPSVGIAVGDGAPFAERTIYASADAWIARVGTERSYAISASPVPFGAGAAACLAAANLFRAVAMPDARLDHDSAYCTYRADAIEVDADPADAIASLADLPAVEDTALVGAGAIGQTVVWTLARTGLRGVLHVVDPETVELSNLQRYVLSLRGDEGGIKTDLAARHLTGDLAPAPAQLSWAQFVAREGHRWRHALVALDSARDRRLVQASLPQHVLNAWTQPGDLGLSSHGTFGTEAACLACLYLPSGAVPSEDELIAEALGVPHERLRIRELLYQRTPAPHDLLEAIAAARELDLELLLAYAHRPVRELYVEGFCGGGVLPLARLDGRDRAVHVPLAFQSALAGVQLAASFVRQIAEGPQAETRVTRIDPLAPLGQALRQTTKADPTGRCICRDTDYRAAYAAKWQPD